MAMKADTPRIAKIQLEGELKDRFEAVEKTLKERGAKDVTLNMIVDRIIQRADSRTFEAIVEDLTPFEFRLKTALQDEKKRKQILKILDQKSESSVVRQAEPEQDLT